MSIMDRILIKPKQPEPILEETSADSPDENRPRGTWQSSSTMTDEEAHRDARYGIKSSMYQTFYMFETQMALFSKRKLVYALLGMAIMIPVIYVMVKDLFPMGSYAEDSGNGVMGIMLFMLPLILGIFTSFLCGSLMPREFEDRSAYMNMALPMSRVSFCLGKYLAGLVITIGVFVFAFAMAMAGSMIYYQYYDGSALGMAFVLLFLAIMVYTSFSFALGCVMKRGSSILSLILMVFVLPGVEMFCVLNGQNNDILTYLPNLLPDYVCFALGSSSSSSMVGLVNSILPMVELSSFSLPIASALAVLWTVGFLALGIFAINRREI